MKPPCPRLGGWGAERGITVSTIRLKPLLKECRLRIHTANQQRRNLDPALHTIRKRNTQKIERKHLTMHTRLRRLGRKTICFSKLIQMHDIVIGLLLVP